MSADDDIQVGIDMIVCATRDDVVAACRRSIEFLGKHADIASSGSRLVIKVKPGLSAKLSNVSPTVGVSLLPQASGDVRVIVRIEQYRTLQSRFMFIPIGPKRLVGKTEYLNLLTSLEQELGAVNKPKGHLAAREAT